MSDTLHATLLRLAAVCASDDARALAAPWIWTDETFLWNEAIDHGVLAHGNTNWPVSFDNREVIANARNRLPELARVLADAAKRIDLLENLAIQDATDATARDQLREQVVMAERERDQRIIDHRDALDQWEAEVNVAVADETKVVKERIYRSVLWEAINAYVITCGGDPSEHVYENAARMAAVVRVEIVSDCVIDRDVLKTELLRLIEENSRLRADGVEFRGCPCRHVTPCRDSCSCANMFLSGGCDRCCSYGSWEQRQAKAERMVADLAGLDNFRVQVERLSRDNKIISDNHARLVGDALERFADMRDDRNALHAEVDQLKAKLAEMTAARDGLVSLFGDIRAENAGSIEPWQVTRVLELKLVGKEPVG